jgi:hypothetical protein
MRSMKAADAEDKDYEQRLLKVDKIEVQLGHSCTLQHHISRAKSPRLCRPVTVVCRLRGW